jgi:hypothetical protein
VTPKVEKKEPCMCCRKLIWVFPGRSYLPGPLCRGCREMAAALEDDAS